MISSEIKIQFIKIDLEKLNVNEAIESLDLLV